ncbi:MAG: hemerythrin domain-containing protein [Sandaracinaceae bacterium]|nr:hemerythrin domain-containing protein [Sandaracinaceae bacterium]
MPPSLHQLLLDEHRKIEARMARLADAAEGADAPTLIREWTGFEAALRAHLDVEEAQLFGRVAADERAGLLAEHRALRDRLDELGLEVELHQVRRATIDAFLAALRAHAAREDGLLYRAADEMPEPAQATFLAQL